jgi:hypothetical protein
LLQQTLGSATLRSPRSNLPAAALASAATLGVWNGRAPAESCGIVGVVGKPDEAKDDARGFLLEGLQVSKWRLEPTTLHAPRLTEAECCQL